MNKLIILAAALILSGCTNLPRIAKGVAAAKSVGAEKIADAVLKKNEERLCNWPTIGSLQREYRNNPTKHKAYHDFCGHKVGD